MKLSKVLPIMVILSWVLLMETPLSQPLTNPMDICEGSISFSLSPTKGFTGDTITASVNGLNGQECTKKRIYIKEGNCQGLQYCSCIMSKISEEIYGCSCTFRVPNTPYISGKEPENKGKITYYACVDLDNDSIYEEDLGEQTHTDLTVYSRYAVLGLISESIIIIITLGVLLMIIIVVFRISLRRR